MITLEEIQALTDNNQHTDAYILGCKYLEPANPDLANELIGKLEAVKAEHERLGHMPYPLIEKRYRLYEWMMSMAKYLPEEEYKAFYMCF